jgi:hypothetical protein
MLYSKISKPALRPIREFCAVYRVSLDYAYDQIKKGKLDARKVGPRTHITSESEDSWYAGLPPLPRDDQSAA